MFLLALIAIVTLPLPVWLALLWAQGRRNTTVVVNAVDTKWKPGGSWLLRVEETN